jgi:ABC-type lipoprotein release transport system permease subunit
MGIELKIKDLNQAAQVARTIEKALGGLPYHAIDWYELNEQLFINMGLRKP